MTKALTNLTYSAIRNLVEEKDETLPVVLQVLEELESELKSNDNRFGSFLFSDGYSCKEFILTTTGFDMKNFLSQKYYPIIKITDVKRRGKFFIITKFEVLDPNNKEKIGQPLEFDQFKALNYINPNGSNEIVRSKAAYSIKLNSTKKQSIKVEQQNDNENNNVNSQTKSGFKLSLGAQKQNTQKQAVQKIENPLSLLEIPILKISDLYPGIRGFKIKGRIVTKSDITMFKSGFGQFFKIEIIDSHNVVIGAAFFNSACDKFFNRIEKGKVYTFQNGTVKTNKFQSKIPNVSEYQITFEEFSIISESEDDKEIKQCSLNLKTIEEIEDMQIDSYVDILGVVSNVQKPYQITTKTSNEQRTKRTLTVFDQTQKGIEITFWGEIADKLEFAQNQIAAFKSMRITEYQGKRGLSATTLTMIEKDIKQLQQLKGYNDLVTFLEENSDKLEQTREARMKHKTSYIDQIEKEFESNNNLKFQKFFEVRGYITHVLKKAQMYYESCQTCYKKVQQQNKQYFCQSCNKSMDFPKYRYILNVKVTDCSGSFYASLSNDLAIQVLSNTTPEQYHLMLDNDKDNILKKATNQQFRFLIIGKMEEYNGVIKHKYQIVNIIQNDYAAECQQLFNQINELLKSH